MSENNEENKEVSQADSIKGCLLIIIVVVAIFFFFKSCIGCSSDSDSAAGDWPKKCETCGKTYDRDDTYYGKSYMSDTYLHHPCSSSACAKCTFEYSNKCNKERWKKQLKEGRNKWVDENPQEAKRRGIHKL